MAGEFQCNAAKLKYPCTSSSMGLSLSPTLSLLDHSKAPSSDNSTQRLARPYTETAARRMKDRRQQSRAKAWVIAPRPPKEETFDAGGVIAQPRRSVLDSTEAVLIREDMDCMMR